MIKRIITIISFIFYSFIAEASTVTTYANNDSSNVYTANYSNIVSNINAQAQNPSGTVLPSGSGTVDVGRFFTVKINWLNPNDWKKCFASSWNISKPSGSTAFVPLIKVGLTVAIACVGWEGKVTLHGYGQCKFLGPFVRVCARNTAPCTHGNDRCCTSRSNDTPTSTDCSAPSADNDLCPNCEATMKYRICAFEDPMFPADLTDTKSGMMPFHRQTSVPPSVTGGNSVVMAGAFLFAVGVLIPGLGAAAMLAGAGLMLAGGIMDLIQFITSKMNYTVVANHGCVDVPLTPFPPPFCSPIPGFSPQVSAISICHYSSQYALSSSTIAGLQAQGYTSAQINNLNYKQISTADAQCEIAQNPSGVQSYSTYENPTMRLFFNNPLPFCNSNSTSGTVQPGSDTCVVPVTLSTPYNLWFNNFSNIPVCSATITTNCIRFPSGISYNFPFRPYYNYSNTTSLGLDASAASQPTPFIVLPSLPTSMKSIAPTIIAAGINNSKFIDVAAGNIVKVTDFVNSQRTFLVTLNDVGDQVCAFERTYCTSNCTSYNQLATDIPISCVQRPVMMNRPSVNACNNNNIAACLYSGSLTPATQPRALIYVGNPAKAAVIGIDLGTSNSPTDFCVYDDVTAYNNAVGTSSSNPTPCSVYGSKIFGAYLTDIYNQSPMQANNGTITPTYTPGGAITVQYQSGLYCRGATQICLSGYADTTKQVVAKKITYNTFDANGNSISQTVISNDVRDRIIPPYTAGSTTISSFFNPNVNYLTTTSNITRTAIGGKDRVTGALYENLACTSDPNVSCVANGTPTANNPVTTTCTCTGTSVSSNVTTSTCSISGCEWAFLTSITNAPIEIGGFDSTSQQYYQNTACTNNVNQNCTYTGNPTIGNPVPTTCQCLNATTNTMQTCTISGCEWAFQPANTNTVTNVTGFYDAANNISYPDASQSLYGVRNANSIELGLCAPIVQPSCSAITHTFGDATAGNDGYANWNSATLGSSITGNCISGTQQSSNGPPTRTCVYVDSGTYQQITLPNGTAGNGCPNYTVAYGPVTNPCVPICPTITVPTYDNPSTMSLTYIDAYDNNLRTTNAMYWSFSSNLSGNSSSGTYYATQVLADPCYNSYAYCYNHGSNTGKCINYSNSYCQSRQFSNTTNYTAEQATVTASCNINGIWTIRAQVPNGSSTRVIPFSQVNNQCLAQFCGGTGSGDYCKNCSGKSIWYTPPSSFSWGKSGSGYSMQDCVTFPKFYKSMQPNDFAAFCGPNQRDNNSPCC